MANWCYNTVTFRAEPEQLEQLQVLFSTLQAKCLAEDRGQMPDFIDEETGYLFNIEMEDGLLTYETKWSPNIGIIHRIADRYWAGFNYNYEETANGIFGEAIYENGVLTDLYLQAADFALYDYDEQNEVYEFEGETYEDHIEILEILLERRKMRWLTVKDDLKFGLNDTEEQ